MLLRNLKIGYRLGICFTLILASLTIVTFYGLEKMEFISNSTTRMYKHPLAVNKAVLRITTDIIKIHRAMKDVVLASNIDEIKTTLTEVGKLEKEVYDNFMIIDERFLGEKTLHKKALTLFYTWGPIRDEVVALMRSGEDQKAAFITKTKGANHVARLEDAMKALADFADGKATEFYRDSLNAENHAIKLMSILMIITIVSVLILAVLSTLSITRPLISLKDSMLNYKGGIPEIPAQIESRDEIGRLSESFTKMAEEIKRTTVSKDYMENILAGMHDTLAVISPEFEVVMVNRPFCELLGYEKDEITGKPFKNFLLNKELFTETELTGLNENGYFYNAEKVYTAKNGEQIAALFSASLMKNNSGKDSDIICAAKDIRKYKKAEKMTQHLGRIIDGSLNEVYVFDSVTKRFITVNKGARHNIGYSMDELRRLTPVDIKPAFTVDSFEELVQPLTAGERDMLHFETIHKRKDGSTYPVDIYLQLSDLGDKKAFVAIILDITTRKQYENERDNFINELESKNAELERFTYTVSHDLKSPLVTVKGFIGFLEKDIQKGDTEHVNDDIARIGSAVKKMEALLNELLELSRIGRLVNPPEWASLEETATEASKLVAGHIDKRDATINIAPGMPSVFADKQRLVETLQNLIENAIKYMGDQKNPRVEIGCRKGCGENIFFVRDNGIGIEPEYHDKIFKLFEKLDPKSDGTGIGLAIVKRIIETHKGKIWVESEGCGKGSAFCFTIGQQPDKVAANS